MKKEIAKKLALITVLFWAFALGIAFTLLIEQHESVLWESIMIGSAFVPALAWLIYYYISRPTRIDNHVEIIACPECLRKCQATVEHTFPWHTYIHECEHCGYIIGESEWNRY